MLEFLANSANAQEVWYETDHSHTATHFKDKPDLVGLSKEAIQKLELEDDWISIDLDMGRTIGVSDLVETDDTDELVYAERAHRHEQGPALFTKSRQSQPCNMISVHFERQGGRYLLASVWIGDNQSPNFPMDARAEPNSIEFWNTHALVWGTQTIVPETLTTKCPWA